MTNSNETYKQLFTPSGCLTLKTIENYNSSNLTPGESALVDEHINTCGLCKDAIEGWQYFPDTQKQKDIVEELNGNLKKITESDELTPSKKDTFSIKFLSWAAAASILLFIGTYSYYQFYWVNPDSKISESNIYDEIVIDKSETPLQEKELKVEERIEEQSLETNQSLVIESVPEPIIIELEEEVQTQLVEADVIEPIEHSIIEEKVVEDEDFQANQPMQGMALDIASVNQTIECFIDGVTISADVLQLQEVVVTNESTRASKKASKGRKTKRSKEKKEDKSNSFTTTVDQLPEFPGGKKELHQFLYNNINYPEEAKFKGIQGTVLTTFIVEENGEISNISIAKGIGGGCDEETLRVISLMPSWNPGLNKGNPIRVQYSMPINFLLN